MPYSFCTEVEWFGLFLTIITNTAALCGLTIIVYGIKQSFSNTSQKLTKSFLITYYITCILWISALVGYATVTMLPYTALCSNLILINQIGTIFGFNGYFGSLIGIYLLFILRLKYIFIDHSILMISNCKYYLLLSGVFLQTVIFAAAFYLLHSLYWVLGAMLIYLFSITNALYSIILLIAFWTLVFKLHHSSLSIINMEGPNQSRHTTQDTDVTDVTSTISATTTYTEVTERTAASKPTTKHEDNNTNTVDATCTGTFSSSVSGPSVTRMTMDTIHMRHPHNDLAECIAKYTTCVLFMILSTMMANVMAFYRGFISDTFVVLRIHVAFVMIDMLVNIVCLHLQFGFAERYYLKLCGGCLRYRFKSYAFKKFDANTKAVKNRVMSEVNELLRPSDEI